MTRTKVWRLSLAAILGFGWLFLTPAYSDDPLSLAAKEIQELNKSVSDLNYKDEFISLIDTAEEKYDQAVSAKQVRDDAYAAYDAALEAEATALSEKDAAQHEVDGQAAIVAAALTQKNSAKDALDIAEVNLATANTNLQSAKSVIDNAGGDGLQYTVYNLARIWPSYAVPDSVICSGTWNSNYMGLPVCGNIYENIVVKFTGKITVPSWFTTVAFAGYTDDGFKMYIDGSLAVNNWREQGATWSQWSPTYDVTQDKTFDVEIWWYNGGGPGSYHLGWTIPGGMTGAGCDYAGNPRVWGENFSCNLNTFSSGSGPTQSQIDAYNAAVTAKTTAQTDYDTKLATYNTKLSSYNTANSTLKTYNQTLTSKTTAYNTAKSNTTAKLTDKNNASETYYQSIIDLNNAIDDAWKYYDYQKEREIQIAIAQAAANAAANQPTPVASPDPEPTVEPTPEPTVKPTPSTTDNIEIKDEILASLIPEKGTGTSEDLSGVIANLTSKDNKLVILSKEQIAAVSQTLVALTQEAKSKVAQDLGIKSSEVAVIAEAMKSNPELATAFVEFKDRESASENAAMPYTLADATTEVQTEAFLADPIGAILDIDLSKVLNPSEWGKDMTDDQREKVQEVVIPVVIASNIVAAAMTRRI